MSFCKTPAVTLKRSDYSDSSQIITFYTRDYGKIQTLAKGLKRTVKGVSGGIDLLTYNNIVFIHRERSNLNILTEWLLQDNFYLIRENLKKSHSALYILELIKEFTKENDKNEPLFDLFLKTLYEITDNGAPDVSILTFEIQMLALLGYLPEMKQCVACKANLNSKKVAFFSALGGGLFCTYCVRDVKERIKISGGTMATINYLAGNTKKDRLIIQQSLQFEIRNLLRYYISFLLSKELKMWRYL